MALDTQSPLHRPAACLSFAGGPDAILVLTVNGRYTLAATSEERMAIAMVAAIHYYFQQHPQGVMPSQGFLADYLKPFIERELVEARLDELHTLSRFGSRERELLDSLHRTIRECCERTQHT